VADDIGVRQGRDAGRINTSEDHDLRYWSKQLGVTEDKLMEAVRYVGNSAQKVREYLMSGSGLSNIMEQAPGSSDAGSSDS
jgi:hypothetical protein